RGCRRPAGRVPAGRLPSMRSPGRRRRDGRAGGPACPGAATVRMRLRFSGAQALRSRARRPAPRPAAGGGAGGHGGAGRARATWMAPIPGGGRMRFETKAIHAGQEPEPAHGAVNVPIYQTSTYAQEEAGKPRTYEYARTGNATRTALEDALGALEGARALCFASGLAAVTTVLSTLRPGDHVVLADDVYCGTYRMLDKVLGQWGLEIDAVDLTDPDAVRSAMRAETRLVWVETPTNPTMKIIDIDAVAGVAHDAGARCLVDNTFASPYLQRPLELGADLVVHSAT